MLKFIVDKFRHAPGPLKEPRLIIADLAEEILDLVSVYFGKDREVPPCESPTHSQNSVRYAPSDDHIDSKNSLSSESSEEKSPKIELEIDERLRRALFLESNRRKQEFKVLAILWDAKQRNLLPLSAKAVSSHGEKLGLSIRHENVRKVIRMRLEKYVDFHTEGVGNGTIYRYRLNDAGVEYFASKFFK